MVGVEKRTSTFEGKDFRRKNKGDPGRPPPQTGSSWMPRMCPGLIQTCSLSLPKIDRDVHGATNAI